MGPPSEIAKPDAVRRIRRIQTITVGWMIVEGAVSLVLAWRAHSPALLVFGGDSAIELLSAIAVLWRFRKGTEAQKAEYRASLIGGVLLFALSGYVVVTAIRSLLGYAEPKPTYAGILILVTASVVMPWLAREKRRLSLLTGSAALRADAAESALCGYLALIALVGVAVHAAWHIRLADPIAALVITPLIISEGRAAVRGKSCACS
ncbi:MAG TPA: cation transporter [Candidatus Binatia bacterium]|nr:cation transporter [Candidatus Binatia bacterium]